jgi:hypothetical protein
MRLKVRRTEDEVSRGEKSVSILSGFVACLVVRFKPPKVVSLKLID